MLKRSIREDLGRLLRPYCRSSLPLDRPSPVTGLVRSTIDKKRLPAIRHVFDSLNTGHIVPYNPAAFARGASQSTRKQKPPIFDARRA
jgi:hypothetical protein